MDFFASRYSAAWSITVVTDARTRRAVVVEDADQRQVATVLDDLTTISTDAVARAAISELLARGRDVGLMYCHDHRQKTTEGLVYRMYGLWCKPNDERFLDALADGLFEFGFIAYTVETTTP